MGGRFSTRRAAPEFPPVAPALPMDAASSAPAAVPPPPPAADAIAWTVFPQAEPEPEPSVPLLLAPAPPVPAQAAAPQANPLLTDKLLDAKVRLHRKLIEEI